MEVLNDLEPTKHIRLDSVDEYLILHTPIGTFDIDVKNATIQLNEKASGTYSISRIGDRKSQPLIKPILSRSSVNKK